MNPRERLKQSAKALQEILEHRDLSEPLLKEANSILAPILEKALTGRSVPGELPNNRFFFGTHDWELASTYLHDSELMNAIEQMDSALRKPSLRRQVTPPNVGGNLNTESHRKGTAANALRNGRTELTRKHRAHNAGAKKHGRRRQRKESSEQSFHAALPPLLTLTASESSAARRDARKVGGFGTTPQQEGWR